MSFNAKMGIFFAFLIAIIIVAAVFMRLGEMETEPPTPATPTVLELSCEEWQEKLRKGDEVEVLEVTEDGFVTVLNKTTGDGIVGRDPFRALDSVGLPVLEAFAYKCQGEEGHLFGGFNPYVGLEGKVWAGVCDVPDQLWDKALWIDSGNVAPFSQECFPDSVGP